MVFSAVAALPTPHGIFRVQAVRLKATGGSLESREHLIVYKGEIAGAIDIPLRIHSSCATGEALGSLRCDCNEQLMASLAFCEAEGVGMVIYLRQEGRGIGLFNKIDAYALQDRGLDTVDANLELGLPTDSRSYEIPVQILRHFGIRSVRLLTNNPRKMAALEEQGIVVTERVPVRVPSTIYSDRYLETKRRKLAHFL